MNSARQIISRMNADMKRAWMQRIALCETPLDAEGLLEEILTAAVTATMESDKQK